MSERIPNRVRTIRNWATPDLDSLTNLRETLVPKIAEEWLPYFQSRENQAHWNLKIGEETAQAMADMLGAFELGARQVYYKVGYSDEEIENLQSYRFVIGTHDIATATEDSIRTLFAYDEERRFLIDIPCLYSLAEFALNHGGYSPYVGLEHAHAAARPMSAMELCEISGVEEAAHSLFHEHHPIEFGHKIFDPEKSKNYNYISHPVERAALKWKRNYAIRFMPEFAQGFIDMENKLASGTID